ncbi:MAG: hypothetical protein ACLFSV_11525, partial [Alkalispirochaeta sp.]
RYFDELPERIPLKRWRCPGCRAVHTARSETYWRRFPADQDPILNSLSTEDHQKQWLPQYSRQQQQYWWRGFPMQSSILGAPITPAKLAGKGFVPASHWLSSGMLRRIAGDRHIDGDGTC